MNINFYINSPPPPHTHTQSPIEIWARNVQGAKRPEGAKRPGAKRTGAKRPGGETSGGGNGFGAKRPGTHAPNTAVIASYRLHFVRIRMSLQREKKALLSFKSLSKTFIFLCRFLMIFF